MPTFDASLVDEMSYDFTGPATGSQEGVAGVMPEPSSEAVNTLLEVVRQIMPVGTDPATGDPYLDLDALSERFEDNPEEIETILNAGIASTFQNQPTAEQIHALPHRAKTTFYGWVLGTLFNPES